MPQGSDTEGTFPPSEYVSDLELIIEPWKWIATMRCGGNESGTVGYAMLEWHTLNEKRRRMRERRLGGSKLG